MKLEIIHKMGKYLLCSFVVYFVLKYMSNEKMSESNIILLSLMTGLIFAIVESSLFLVENKQKQDDKTQCESFCSIKEHMMNLDNDINTVKKDLTNFASALTNSEEIKQHAKKDLSTDYDKFQKRFSEIVEDRTEKNPQYKTDSEWISRNADASYTMYYKRRSPDIEAIGSRAEDGMIKDDTKYNVISYNTVPPNVNQGSFEYGYSFMPPSNWYPTPPFPPVCVAEKKANVCPTYTSGTNIELKEWDSARRITPPDEINVKYVEEVLNSGR